MIGSPPPVRRPWYHLTRILPRLVLYPALFFAVLFIGVCVIIFKTQNAMLYPGAIQRMTEEEATRQIKSTGLVPWDQPAPGVAPFPGTVWPDFKNHGITMSGGIVEQHYPRGTFIHFHGNGEVAWDHWDVVEAYRRRGFRVFFYEYPGYGGRPGSPSEKAIVPDAQALIRSLDAAGYGPIYVWGQSLGAGVAASVCADPTLPVHGLILASPWDTLAGVAHFHFPYLPVSLMLIDRYNSIENLRHFGKPICVLRGGLDGTVPPACSIHLLQELQQPKKEIVFPSSGHGDWSDAAGEKWWDEALDFVAPQN